MTTANSLVETLRKQANKIAIKLKELKNTKLTSTIGIAMDDGFLTIELTQAAINNCSIQDLENYILTQMQRPKTKYKFRD